LSNGLPILSKNILSVEQLLVILTPYSSDKFSFVVSVGFNFLSVVIGFDAYFEPAFEPSFLYCSELIEYDVVFKSIFHLFLYQLKIYLS